LLVASAWDEHLFVLLLSLFERRMNNYTLLEIVFSLLLNESFQNLSVFVVEIATRF
jgi:hypothetical protein